MKVDWSEIGRSRRPLKMNIRGATHGAVKQLPVKAMCQKSQVSWVFFFFKYTGKIFEFY